MDPRRRTSKSNRSDPIETLDFVQDFTEEAADQKNSDEG